MFCFPIHFLDFTIGRNQILSVSRPVTRSYLNAHNNLVTELVVICDAVNLAAKLDAFMGQIGCTLMCAGGAGGRNLHCCWRNSKGAHLEIILKRASRQGSGGYSCAGNLENKSEPQSRGSMVPRYS